MAGSAELACVWGRGVSVCACESVYVCVREERIIESGWM